jgi:selenocysteine lyase/cysteine desulfurase
VADRYGYFDHAGVAPLSRPAAEAVRWWADRMLAQGKVGYDELAERVEAVRADSARLLGVGTDDVAFVKNTTEGLAFAANGLELAPGDRVVIPDREFPSTLFPWLALERRGVVVDRVAPEGPHGAVTVDAFEAVVRAGPPPKVIVLSWVQFGTGWRADLAAMAALAHRHGAVLVADVIQGLGVIPAALADWGVDIAMADGHKWLLGPEGLGVLYVSPAVRDRLQPQEPGWASVADRGSWDSLDLTWHPSAARYEGGTANVAGTLGLGASVQLLLDAGIDRVWHHVQQLGDHLVAGLEQRGGATVISDRSPEHRSGIVTFGLDDEAPEATAERLNAAGFVVSPRGGGVRIAPHAYQNTTDIDRLLASL